MLLSLDAVIFQVLMICGTSYLTPTTYTLKSHHTHMPLQVLVHFWMDIAINIESILNSQQIDKVDKGQ